jgi:hypothetical protein
MSKIVVSVEYEVKALAIEHARVRTVPKPWGTVDLRLWSNARPDGSAIGEIRYERPGSGLQILRYCSSCCSRASRSLFRFTGTMRMRNRSDCRLRQPGIWPDGWCVKAGLIECDLALAVCAKLLTIEIFFTGNLGVKASAQGTSGPRCFQVSIFPRLPRPKRAQQGPAAGECETRRMPPARRQIVLM